MADPWIYCSFQDSGVLFQWSYLLLSFIASSK
ncbi:unnamed protein product, partial [Vitis vinifera]|uniref:Uncharacterized protein n=1 Tax=Vitis vinifera TaxID=29760 RepID=D7T9N1_VITVI